MHMMDCTYCKREHPPIAYFGGDITPTNTKRGYLETRQVLCDICAQPVWRFYKNIEEWRCAKCKRSRKNARARDRYWAMKEKLKNALSGKSKISKETPSDPVSHS